MLAARELNVDKLPESSRNWINEKLIYTHGYGITMNPVNGFTPEGLPTLLPEQHAGAEHGARPERDSSGDLFRRADRTPTSTSRRGNRNSTTRRARATTSPRIEGNGGIVLGGFLRRILLALDRGDLGKLPFSDDVNAQSRLLMRRNVRDRVAALAPFLTYDPDPYIVVGDDGRLSWVMDAFTTSDQYPYSTHYQLGDDRINYMRNSVKVVIDAYDGTDHLLRLRQRRIRSLPPIAASFPALFKDASAMPPGCASTCATRSYCSKCRQRSTACIT